MPADSVNTAEPGADQVQPEGGAGRLAVADGEEPPAERGSGGRPPTSMATSAKATAASMSCDAGVSNA